MVGVFREEEELNNATNEEIHMDKDMRYTLWKFMRGDGRGELTVELTGI